MAVRKHLPEELRKVQGEFFKTMSTLVVSAFSLVAALAWNTAVTKIIEHYFKVNESATISSWLWYAVIVTLVAVIVTVYVGRIAQRFQEEAAEKPQLEKE